MWARCGRVSLMPFAARAASTASSALADGAVAERMEVRLEPGRVERGHVLLQRLGVDEVEAPVRRRDAARVEVRVDHRRRVRLDDAVEQQLHAVRPEPARRRASGTFEELVDLFEPSLALPPQRRLDPGGHQPALGSAAVRREDVGPDGRVLPRRDAQSMQVRLGDLERRHRARRRCRSGGAARRSPQRLRGASRSASRRGRARSGRRPGPAWMRRCRRSRALAS